MRLHQLLALICLLLPALSAVGEPKGVAVWGIGKNSCAAYLNQTDKSPYLVWTSGYLTGRLYEAMPENIDMIFKHRDVAVYEYFLTDYCTKFPTRPFFNASDSLMNRFMDAYMQEKGEQGGKTAPSDSAPTPQLDKNTGHPGGHHIRHSAGAGRPL